MNTLDSCVKDITLETAYWGLRWALHWNMTESVTRMKIWLSRAIDVLDPSYIPPPPMWFSLSKLPDESTLHEWEESGFMTDQLRHFELSKSNPTVIKGVDSYLLRYIYHFKEALAQLYMVSLSMPLWGDLMHQGLLSHQKSSLPAGVPDAVDANEMMLYGKTNGVIAIS